MRLTFSHRDAAVIGILADAREIEYAFDVEEPMAGMAPTGDVE